MPYSGNPGDSPKDEVRFLIGDTGTVELLTDDEITWLLEQSGGIVVRAAYRAVHAMIAEAAKTGRKTVGPTTIDMTSKVEGWRALLDSLATQGGAVGFNLLPGAPIFTGEGIPSWNDVEWSNQ